VIKQTFVSNSARRFLVDTKDFLRLGVPLGETKCRATDFISKFILGGNGLRKLNHIPLDQSYGYGHFPKRS
jgi:hypothetical protein